MLREKLKESLITAMKSKEELAVSTIRLILAALKDRDIAARSKGNKDGIAEDEILSMLQGMIKQRRESISMYEQGGRLELAQQEQDEIGIIERFLPTQMNESQVQDAVKKIITQTQASSVKDMGRVMAALREQYAGQMDFSTASAQVKQLLS